MRLFFLLWRRERDSKPGGRQPYLVSGFWCFSGNPNFLSILTNRPFFEGSHPLSLKNQKTTTPGYPRHCGNIFIMAEREGFEPSDRVNSHTISSRAPSTNSAISPLIELLLVLKYYTKYHDKYQQVFVCCFHIFCVK